MLCTHSHLSPQERNTHAFSAGWHFLSPSGTTVLFKKRNLHLSLKKGLGEPGPFPSAHLTPVLHPHLQCVEDVMVRCYFPLAQLLEITACDCDKWIFPLNSLVEWGIPLTTGTIPTQVKHWVIFFLVSKK